MKPKIKQAFTYPLALDSGAYSFYTKHAAPRTAEGKIIRTYGSNHSYATSLEFNRYLDDYMTYIKENGHQFSFCVSLDVIGDPVRSAEIFDEMTKQGLRVMPVYHFGENEKFLRHYMDVTDYVGIGGLVKTGTPAGSRSFQERTWKVVCDKKGRPRVRLHAFGLSSFEPLFRYAYYSIDSQSSFWWSRYGCIMLPRRGVRGFDFCAVPLIFPLSKGRSTAKNHLDHHPPGGMVRATLDEYIAGMGVALKEVREEYGAKDFANMYFMNNMMKDISQKHSERLGVPMSMIYYASGNFSTSADIFRSWMGKLALQGQTKQLGYLGTFAALRPVMELLEKGTT